MYKLVALFALVAFVSAARIRRATDEPVPILKSESDYKEDGSYSFSFEGGDGQSRSEIGTIQNAGQEDAFVAVVGSWKYIDADGQTHEVTYTADKNGFVPAGDIPEAIVKGVQANLAAAESS